MADFDSALNPVARARVRALLRAPRRERRSWPAIAAAAFAALSAMTLAVMMIASPPVWNSPPAKPGAAASEGTLAVAPAAPPATASAALDGLRN